MKKLVDTCGWIEWLTNGTLADSFNSHLSKPEKLIVPTLIQFELYKWICRERTSTLALEIVGVTETAMVVPLDTRIALSAAEIARDFNLAMADAIIYATATAYEATIITCDKHFIKLPNVKFFEKTS